MTAAMLESENTCWGTAVERRPLRLGVLGLGEGRSVLSAACASPAWNVAMLCDLNEDLGRRRLAEFGAGRFTSQYQEMLDSPDVDVIAIYTPDFLHATHTIQALEHGKHVICTKPLFDSLEPAAAVWEACKRSGREVMVGQSSRFFEPMLQQRADFEVGAHGQLLTVEAHYNHDHRGYLDWSWAAGGRIQWAFGGLSHPVDLIRWYIPDIEEVFAYGSLSPDSASKGLKSPDTIHVVMKSRSGLSARVSGCYGAPTLPEEAEDLVTCTIRGSRGTTQSNYYSLRYARAIAGQPAEVRDNAEKYGYYFRFEGRSNHAGEFQNYLEHFADALAAGMSPHPTLGEGIVTVAVMAAISRSVSQARPVRIAELLAEHGLQELAAEAGLVDEAGNAAPAAE